MNGKCDALVGGDAGWQMPCLSDARWRWYGLEYCPAHKHRARRDGARPDEIKPLNRETKR